MMKQSAEWSLLPPSIPPSHRGGRVCLMPRAFGVSQCRQQQVEQNGLGWPLLSRVVPLLLSYPLHFHNSNPLHRFCPLGCTELREGSGKVSISLEQGELWLSPWGLPLGPYESHFHLLRPALRSPSWPQSPWAPCAGVGL